MENNRRGQDFVKDALPKLTGSSVNDLNCPYRYKKLRILKQWPIRDNNTSQAFGEAAHEVLRETYNRKQEDQLDLSQIELHARTAVFRARYPKGIDRNTEIPAVIDAVKKFVNADTSARIAGTVANEQFVEVPIAHDGTPVYLLSTKLDRVVIDPVKSQVRVIDYKLTDNRGIDLKAALIMLWAAKHTYKGYSSYVIEYVFLGQVGDIERTEVHDHELRGIYKLVTEQAREVLSATEFP